MRSSEEVPGGAPDGFPRMSVVIATLGRPDRLRMALADLERLDRPPHEILVVDGDPQRSAHDVVADLAPAFPAPLRVIGCAPGLTRQRNAGLTAVRGDVVVFLDDDARPEPDALERLAAAYRDPDVVGATGRVLEQSSHRFVGQHSRLRSLVGGRRPGTFTRCGYPRRLPADTPPGDVELMPGCFMSARLEAARRVGFDERLPGYALAEDEDFSYRLSRIGRIRFVPAAAVHHDNSGFGSRDRRAFSRTVVIHRRYLFEKNFVQTLSARAEFVAIVGLLLAHRLVNLDFAGALGVVDGVAALREHRAGQLLP